MYPVKVTRKVSWGGVLRYPNDTLYLSKPEANHFIKKGIGVLVEDEPAIIEDDTPPLNYEPSEEDLTAYLEQQSPDIATDTKPAPTVEIVRVGGAFYKVLVNGELYRGGEKELVKGIKAAEELAEKAKAEHD